MDEIIELNGVRYKRIEESITRYKLGDWVKVITNKSGRMLATSYIGDVAMITHVYKFGEFKENGKPAQAYGIDKMYVVFDDELEPTEEPKQDPFDIDDGEKYYYIMSDGFIDSTRFTCDFDNRVNEVANACKDETLMKQRASREILNRLLWKASVKAGELNNPWNNKNNHYTITYDTVSQLFDINFHWCCKDNTIYFPSKESAQSAINNIIKPFMKEHPEFVW